LRPESAALLGRAAPAHNAHMARAKKKALTGDDRRAVTSALRAFQSTRPRFGTAVPSFMMARVLAAVLRACASCTADALAASPIR